MCLIRVLLKGGLSCVCVYWEAAIRDISIMCEAGFISARSKEYGMCWGEKEGKIALIK